MKDDFLSSEISLPYSWNFGTINFFAHSVLQKVNDELKLLERKYFGKGYPIRVVVVGCGYSGVELAATVSERLQDKGIMQAINLESTILPSAPAGNREAALKVRSPLRPCNCLCFDVLPFASFFSFLIRWIEVMLSFCSFSVINIFTLFSDLGTQIPFHDYRCSQKEMLSCFWDILSALLAELVQIS